MKIKSKVISGMILGVFFLGLVVCGSTVQSGTDQVKVASQGSLKPAYSFTQPGTIPEEINETPMNLLRNPSFEYWDTYTGDPMNWETYGTGYGRASQIAYAGVDDSFSARIFLERYHGNDNTDLSQTLPTDSAVKVDQNASLAFYWNVTQNPSTEVDQNWGRVQVAFNNSRYLRYYFTGYYRTNSSGNYYNLNVTGNGIKNTWVFAWLNLTADYTREFGEAPTSVNVSSISFSSRVNINRDCVELFFDNVTLRENFQPNALKNPTFSGTVGSTDVIVNWDTQDHDPGQVQETSSPVIDGSKAGKFSITTSTRPTAGGASTFGMYSQFSWWQRPLAIESDRRFQLSFSWFLEEFTWTSAYPTVYVQLSFTNNSVGQEGFTINLRMASPDNPPYANGSNYRNIVLPGYNETGTWYQYSLDLYSEITPFSNVNSANCTQILFYAQSYGPGASAAVIVDDISVIGPAIFNGEFEENPLSYWELSTTGGSTIQSSSDSFAGVTSINLTAQAGNDIFAYQDYLHIPITSESALELAWKIPESVPLGSSDDITGVLLQTSGGKDIYYLFSCGNYVNLINKTNQRVYLVDGYNETGQWHILRRNIYRDFTATSFAPFSADERFSQITIFVYTDTAGITLLSDSIKIGTTVPIIEGIDIAGGSPSYHAGIPVTADLFDSGTINQAVFYYKNESAGTQWTILPLMKNNPNDMKWSGTLPRQVYNETISYYLEVEDIAGNNKTSPIGGSGAPASFKVGDTLAPSISFVQTSPNPPTKDKRLMVNATIVDPASGLNQTVVVYSVDGGLNWTRVNLTVQEDSPWSSNYTVKLPSFEAYTTVLFYIEAEDKAGNIARDDNGGRYYSRTIRTTWSQSNSFLYGMAAGAGVLGALLLTGVIIRARKRGKASERNPPAVNPSKNTPPRPTSRTTTNRPSSTKTATKARSQPKTKSSKPNLNKKTKPKK